MDNETLLKKFIKDLKSIGRSPSTIIAYKKDLEQLNNYLSKENISFTDTKLKDLNGFIKYLSDTKGFTPKTVSRKINSLKTFFSYLSDEKIINENIAEPVEHPEIKQKKQRILSTLEYKAVRDTTRNNPRLYTMVELLLQTGIRIGELSRLKLDNVNLASSKPHIFVEKFASNDARKVDLNENAVIALKEWLEKRPEIKNDKGYLFPTKNGNPVLVRNIRTSINRAFKGVGINDATVNDIRNTFIVYQLTEGVRLEKVAQTVGHQRLSSTEKYYENIENKVNGKLNKIQPL